MRGGRNGSKRERSGAIYHRTHASLFKNSSRNTHRETSAAAAKRNLDESLVWLHAICIIHVAAEATEKIAADGLISQE